jgi:Rps23 Pro-64 3,4-dihydroxylase Tpa1-like proline 4-hydroxylase
MIGNPFELPATGYPAPRGAPAGTLSHVIFEEFLVRAELVRLLQFTLEHEAAFGPTTVRYGDGKSVVDESYRRSRALFDLASHREVFVERLHAFLPYIFERLRITPFDVTWIESQVTASNDGDFYRRHSDNLRGPHSARAITFVYYFYRPPKAFSGGVLRLRNDRGHAVVVQPRLNQMVLFPSGLEHEILPVSCPSRNFADSRFALNGWIHR